MQSGKNVKGSVEEAAAIVAASAKSGMDKTKATVQEKVEKMTAHDPVEKDMATRKREERMVEAELNKREVMAHNAAARHEASVGGPMGYTASGTGTHTYSTTGATGQPTGPHQMSALPEHGTGQPAGQVTVVGSHPMGVYTGTGRTKAHNTPVGGSTRLWSWWDLQLKWSP